MGEKYRIDILPAAVDINGSKVRLFIIGIVIVSVLTESDLLNAGVSYVLVVVTYLILMLYLWSKNETKLHVPTWSLGLLLIIFIVHATHLIIPLVTNEIVTAGMIIRPPIFAGFALINLFLIPYLVQARFFYSTVLITSTILAAIAIPTAVVDYNLFGIYMSSYASINLGGIRFGTIVSIFGNPNVAAFLFMIGLVTSIALFTLNRKRVILASVIINGIALLLTGSRSAYLGGIAGMLFLFVLMYNEKLARLLILSYSAAVGIGVLVLSGVIPRPSSISPTDLGNRPAIWEAAVEAISVSPFGYGTGDMSSYIDSFILTELAGVGIHSAYLRLFLSAGLIGGVAYCILTVKTLLSATYVKDSMTRLLVFSVMVAISTKEIFEGNTIFGLSMSSFLLSVSYGYAIKK